MRHAPGSVHQRHRVSDKVIESSSLFDNYESTMANRTTPCRRRLAFNPAFVELTGSARCPPSLMGMARLTIEPSESDQAGHMVRTTQIEIYTNTDGPTASSRTH
ncbi:hypothetical protein ACJZ2D_014485 [Fusarium nematophilum]